MSKAKRKPKTRSGGSRMLDNGYKASQLWYRPEDYDLVRKAASIDRRPMTKFAIIATVAAARLVVERHIGHPAARGPKGVLRGDIQ